MKNTFYGIGPGWPAPEERGLDKRNSEHYPMPPVRRKSLQQQGCGLFDEKTAGVSTGRFDYLMLRIGAA